MELELLSLCTKHFTTLLNKQADQIAEFESLMNRGKEDREAQAWKEDRSKLDT